MKEDIQILITLFDPRAALATKVEYMINADHASSIHQLAQDWNDDGEIGLASKFLSEQTDIKTMKYSVFANVAQAFIDLNQETYVKHPVLVQAITFYKSIKETAVEGDDVWQKRLMAATLSARR